MSDIVERRGSELAEQRRPLFTAQPRTRQALGFAVAVGGTAALTGAFLPARSHLTPVSEAFGYLVLVVGVAWIGGLWPGILASFLSFGTFNFFFLPPYNTFVIGSPEHVVVLFVLLGISVLISTLLGRSRERLRSAESRAKPSWRRSKS